MHPLTYTALAFLTAVYVTGCAQTRPIPRSITIQDGVPSTYTASAVSNIVAHTLSAWAAKYGDATSRDIKTLSCLDVYITKDSVNGHLYGVADVFLPRITVWAHSQNPADSAIVHEIIHVLRFIQAGDADNSHSGAWWGAGFESPVKDSLR